MTTKDVMAALERLAAKLPAKWGRASNGLPFDRGPEMAADVATLRAFVTETGPVREVLELDCDILHLQHPGEWCAVNEKMRGTGPTYAAACTAALEAVDGAGAGEEE